MDEIALARAVAEAALAVHGVSSLGKGTYAEAATYGAGEKVQGVVVTPSDVRVHVIAAYPDGVPVPLLVERVRAAVAPLVGDRRLTIVVEDLEGVPEVERSQ